MFHVKHLINGVIIMSKYKYSRFTKTFTKKVTFAMLIVGAISANIPYLLSFLGKDPVESLGITWVTGVVAISLGYFIRGYKDTNAERKQDLQEWVVTHDAMGGLNDNAK